MPGRGYSPVVYGTSNRGEFPIRYPPDLVHNVLHANCGRLYVKQNKTSNCEKVKKLACSVPTDDFPC